MKTLTIRKMQDGRLACVIKGPSGRILLQGFVYDQTQAKALKPMLIHYFGTRRAETEMNNILKELA